MTTPLWLIPAAFIWAFATWQTRRRRLWLAHYAIGAIGLVLIGVFAATWLGFDRALESAEAVQVSAIARALGLAVSVFGPKGIAIGSPGGWSVFDVGLECSALLEALIFAGLVGFYPGFDTHRRAATVAAGVALTYVANLVRVLVIVLIVAQQGGGATFVAHAVVGRLVFFALAISAYWFLMTRPTLTAVARAVGGERDA